MRALVAALAALVAGLAPAWPALAAGGNSWRPAGETATEHVGHTATLLYDGTVLVVGGQDVSGVRASGTELFDPARGAWTTVDSTAVPRTGHAAVRLDDGRVLVAGGDEIDRSVNVRPRPVASAELYDPQSQRWSPAASMAVARYQPTLTVLPDSRVLVAGGATESGQAVTASAEVYDPVANRWSSIASMGTPRTQASAVLLRNGKVLVAGGTEAAANQDGSLGSAELYDIGAGKWSPTPPMPSPHAAADATLLEDGTFLVAGGFDYQGGFGISVSTTDIYDAAANAWTSGPPLQVGRALAGGARLSDGRFLVVGGISRFSARAESTAELYDPTARQWSLAPLLPGTRVGATVTPLRGGGALVVGGTRQQDAVRFQPSSSPAVAGPPTLGGAIRQNLPLGGLTALLLAAVGFQAAWRRSRRGAA